MKIKFKNNLFTQIIVLLVVVSLLYYIKTLLQLSFTEIIGQYFGYISLLLIGLVLFFYYKTRREKENTKNAELYSHLATLLQTIFAIIAIWYAVNESKGNNEQFKTNLSKQDILIGLQKSLIEKQDKTAELNLQALKTLADTSGKLIENVEKVNRLVSEMPSRIDGVSASFAILTEYAKQEAERLEEERLKKADLYISNFGSNRDKDYEYETAYTLNTLRLWNKGNIECRLMKIEMYFDTLIVSYVSPKVSTFNTPTIETKGDKLNVSFDFSYGNVVVSAYDKDFKIDDEFIVKLQERFSDLSNISFNYSIIFYDKNGGRFNEGTYTIKLK